MLRNTASDIDFMIVSEKYDETDDEVIGKIWRLTQMVSTKIEPFMIGKNRYDSADNSPLIEQIKTKDIELTLTTQNLLTCETKAEY